MLKNLVRLLAFLALAGAAILIAPDALGRTPSGAEFAALGLALAAVFARLWLLARRRHKRKLEEMRDSALW